jgi:hypothetical protein
MHYNINPFAPRDDSPVNVLLYENPLELTERVIESNPIIAKLPDNCEFVELSPSSNRKELMDFINRNHGTGCWKRHVTEAEMDYLIDLGNLTFYGIRWNGLIVACASMEAFDINFHGKLYKTAYVDYHTVHPRFRKNGLYNIMTTLLFREVVKSGCVIELFTGHTKLDFKACAVKPSYAYGITNIPYTCGLVSSPPAKPFNIRVRTLKEPTMDDLRKLNNRTDFDVYVTYDDKRLNAMLKFYKIFTDGKTLLCFLPIMKMVNNITIKAAILIDWVNINANVFKEAVEELRKDGFDLISFTNDGELKELTSNIQVEKKEDAYYYTMNILPKTRKGRLNLTIG